MPTISQFFGISILMFWRDHEPAHIHARYGEYHAEVMIESGAVVGSLPPRVLGLVQEWRVLHRRELMAAWDKAKNKKPIPKIKPLE
ncbi:MAG: DUF4160 domain-containing protein [Verrucomicrobiae bacterium]|nr:DUF4160 domain-containing protein [Verrucomicrobiae bacterium]